VSKPVKIVLGAVVALVVVIGALGAYALLRDSAEDEATLAAIGATTVPGAAPSGRTSPAGEWKVAPGETVFVGYRVHEKLRGLDKEVTGRTPDVSGTMTIVGNQVTAADITADLTALKTDDPLRDGAVKRMGLETNTYPDGTFVLTEPIPLSAPPTAGQEVTATAKGNFTIHGVTKPVEVPITASWDGDQIRVATRGGGVRIQFQDYGFGPLSVQVAQTDDFGFFEFQLLFVPA
jgi:polyisoprenoid-binding protein YceI